MEVIFLVQGISVLLETGRTFVHLFATWTTFFYSLVPVLGSLTADKARLSSEILPEPRFEPEAAGLDA